MSPSHPAFTGVFTALVTPFASGKVDFNALRDLVEWQIESGIQGLVPVGTTGESPTLSHQEHQEVIQAVVETARKRVPVIAGTGSNATSEAVELTAAAHAAGADGVLVVAPYYNKPSPEGLFRHFSAVASATDRPVVLYSIPSRCGIEIGVGVVERLLSRHPHVNHIKEAGGSCDRVDALRSTMGDDLVILSGDDGLTLPFISLGARGVISVASNLLPAEVVAMVGQALAGEAAASAAHQRLSPLFKALFIEPNPVPVKTALHLVGRLPSAAVRLPLCEMESTTLNRLKSALTGLGLKFTIDHVG
ncbi:MAG: 4-hydroxy-tetrahydrodipicolinate synthase [Puniceicoccaceae bacterium]|nr:MAG: 4-hydroxy-tetrahydrodipicolinate synthase [Puniceicoccaceae bacterium]